MFIYEPTCSKNYRKQGKEMGKERFEQSAALTRLNIKNHLRKRMFHIKGSHLWRVYQICT